MSESKLPAVNPSPPKTARTEASATGRGRPRPPDGGPHSARRSQNTLANQGVFSAPEHIAPTLPKIFRPMEEISKYCERLAKARTIPLPTDGFMLCKALVKPPKAIEEGMNRLYTMALEQHKHALEKAVSAAAAASGMSSPSPAGSGRGGGGLLPSLLGKLLDDEQLTESVHRLYNTALSKHKTAQESINAKHQFHPPVSPRTTPAAASRRLYYDALENRKKIRAKLWKQYVEHSMPTYSKLTPDKVKASGDRLCTSKK